MEHAVTSERVPGQPPTPLPYSPPDYGLPEAEGLPVERAGGWRQSPADLAASLALLADAARRGWLVAWRAYDPQRDAGLAYEPPGPVSVGVVKAHHPDRTLTVTGVTAATDGVAQIREFLGWPEDSAACPNCPPGYDCATGDYATTTGENA